MHLGLIFNFWGPSATPPPPPPSHSPSTMTLVGLGGAAGIAIAHISLWAGRKVLDMSYAEPQNSTKRQSLRIAAFALITIGATVGYVGSLAMGASTVVGVVGVTGFLGLPLALATGALTVGLSLYSIFSQIHEIGEKDRSKKNTPILRGLGPDF